MMTPAFLAFANLWLLTRLVCLFRDEAAPAWLWMNKTAVELTLLLALYAGNASWLGVAATVAALNFLGYRIEQGRGRKDLSRLLLGLLGIVAFSIWFSPRLGMAFRPTVMAGLTQLGNWTVLAGLLHAISGARFQLIVFGLLLSANESNLVIRAVFDRLDLKPRARAGGAGVIDEGEFNRGRVIGMLERALLYTFVLQAQYGAIGFILAAKAFTRSKALDDRPFAEYVLIGTLLSAGLALVIGGALKWLVLRA